MLKYIAKRLFLFIPTLFLVSCLAFLLKNNVPSDPIETLLDLQGVNDSMESYEKNYNDKKTELGLDKPLFYIGIYSNYNSWLLDFDGSSAEESFAKEFADRKYSETGIRSLISAIDQIDGLSKRRILQCQDPKEVLSLINSSQFENVDNVISDPIVILVNEVVEGKGSWHFPVLKWNGLDNQYHFWMSGILKGDFGVSLVDARPVFDKIWDSMRWTLVLIILGLTITLIFSFLIGLYNGTHQNSRFDIWSNSFLFLWYSIPKFWLATMMIVFFTTAEYGGWTDIFPIVGIWGSSENGFLNMIFDSLDKLILPLLIIIIPDVAYMSRLIRASVIEENKKEYISTARSKGIPDSQILWRHLMPNSLSPTITLMAGVIPSALASSLIIEVIFNIPGMGRLMFESIRAADWAVVFPIVLIVSVVTVISFLLADIFIAWLNPKINLG